MDLTPTVAFLLDRQGADGRWRDFHTLAGEAVDWPTAYVGAALGWAGGPAEAVGRAAAALSADRQPGGAWGYHAGVPADSDTTAYAVAFLSGVGAAAEAVPGAAWLAAAQRADGGVATYPTAGPIRAFMGLGPGVSIGGWTAPQSEVTAAAGLALSVVPGRRGAAERAWAYLAARQDGRGAWASYWWTTDLYATAWAATLSRRLGVGAAARGRAEAWCRAGQAPGGYWTDGGEPSAFATGLALVLLGQAAGPGVRARAVGWLAETRGADGGWGSQAALRIPPPGAGDPSAVGGWRRDALGTGVVVRDQHGTYTAATVLAGAAGE